MGIHIVFHRHETIRSSSASMGRSGLEGRLSLDYEERYKDDEGVPKTASSDREIRLLPAVVDVLKRLKPVHPTEQSYVF
jgi:hypothetical protein